MNKIKLLVIAVFPALLSSCGVSTDGLGLFIDGNRYQVSCDLSFQHADDNGNVFTENISSSIDVCSNGMPSNDLSNNACEVLSEISQSSIQMDYPNANNFMSLGARSTSSSGESCRINSIIYGDGQGFAIRTSMLLRDNSGRMLGSNGLSTSTYKVSSSNLRLGAKFIKWRYANTKAQGEAELDRTNCNTQGCDLVLRHLNIKINDFKIERPTVFAKDVKVVDASLYTLNQYITRVKKDGTFSLSGIKSVVSAVIQGEEVVLLSDDDIQIEGEFSNLLNNQRDLPQTIKLNLLGSNGDFKMSGTAILNATKISASLVNFNTWRCLTGEPGRHFQLAKMDRCSSANQRWTIENFGNYKRVRAPLTNMCLNVKSRYENRDGGQVSIVSCSNHQDQAWAIRSNGTIFHPKTRKCLHADNSERYDGSYVKINTCTTGADLPQQWTPFFPYQAN